MFPTNSATSSSSVVVQQEQYQLKKNIDKDDCFTTGQTNEFEEVWVIDRKDWQQLFMWVSLLSPITTIASIYLLPEAWRFLTYIDMVVAVASVSYWYYPIFGWRRGFDQFAVVGAMLFHYYLIFQYASWAIPFFVALHLIPAGLSYRAVSSKEGVYWWILLHIASHFGNCVLYYFFLLI